MKRMNEYLYNKKYIQIFVCNPKLGVIEKEKEDVFLLASILHK